MLDTGFVRDHRELVERKLKSRGLKIDLAAFFQIDEQRREAIREVEELKRQSNVVSKEIGEAVRRGENVEARKEARNKKSARGGLGK